MINAAFMKRLREMYAILWRSSKRFFLLTIFIKLITLLNTFTLLYVNKRLINEIAECILEKSTRNYAFLSLSILLLAIDISSTVLVSWAQYFLGKIKMRYDDNISLNIALSASKLDMSYYDSPTHFNEMKQAYSYCNAIYSNFNNSIDILFQVCSFVYALFLIVRLNALLAIIAIVGTLPAIFIRKKIKGYNYQVEKELMEDKRFVDYLSSILLNKLTIREIQLFDYRHFLKKKIEKEQEKCRVKKEKSSLFNAKWELMIQLFEKIVGLTGQFLLILSIILKKLTIGDYTYADLQKGTAKIHNNYFSLVIVTEEEINHRSLMMFCGKAAK